MEAFHKQRPNVHQRMRAWYLEGKWGGFYRRGADCIYTGPDTGCKSNLALKLRYVAFENTGHNLGLMPFARPLIGSGVLEACYYPSRDPACPITVKYQLNTMEFLGNSIQNALGPVLGLKKALRGIASENVAIKIHSLTDLMGKAVHPMTNNLLMVGTHPTYTGPTPPPSNGVFNVVPGKGNYVTGVRGPAYIVGRAPSGKNVAACSMIGFNTAFGGNYRWTDEIAMGNQVGFAMYFTSKHHFFNTVIAGNDMGVHFRHEWRPDVHLKDRHPDMGPIDKVEGHNNEELYRNKDRYMKGVTILGHLWDKCAVKCEGSGANSTDYRGNVICDKSCVNADKRGGKIGMLAARGDYKGVFFGRFDGELSALIQTGKGCFTPKFRDTRLLDQDTRDAVKVQYTGFTTDMAAIHHKRKNDVRGGTGSNCGKWDCDYWRHCWIKDVDGTLMIQGKDHKTGRGKHGWGKTVSIIPAYQQWDRTIENGCMARATSKDLSLSQSCLWWIKDQPRIQRAAMWRDKYDQREYQGIQRGTSETLGRSVCEPHTFADNGLLCTKIDYFDVFIRDADVRAKNAARIVGPVGITVEGGVDGRWGDVHNRRPYSTDILGSGFIHGLFRSIVASGYIYRVDFTGNNPDNTHIHAPGILPQQSVVMRTWYSTSMEVRLRKGGKGVRMALYKDEVYPYAKHGTWYYDRISGLLWVTISQPTRLEMVILQVVKISLTCVKTVDQFYGDEGEQFLINLAQVLQINPERIRMTKVVPGNGRRLLAEEADANSTELALFSNNSNITTTTPYVNPISTVTISIIEDDVCDSFNCGVGSCVKTNQGPKCDCGTTGFTGPRCAEQKQEDEVVAEVEIVNKTADDLERKQAIENLKKKDSKFNFNETLDDVDLNVTIANTTSGQCTYEILFDGSPVYGELVIIKSNSTGENSTVAECMPIVNRTNATTNELEEQTLEKDTGLAAVATRFLEVSLRGSLDLGKGVKILPSSIKMTVPNISETTSLFNGSTDVIVEYVRPVYICGNGVRTTDEECDDGNNSTDDGCTPDCKIERGFRCHKNFLGQKSNCSDHDECANTTLVLQFSAATGFAEPVVVAQDPYCFNNARCINLPGDYRCECAAGFEGRNCSIDIDECARGIHSCHDNATCTNTFGSYECSCDYGFTGDGTTCSNINDCTRTLKECKDDSTQTAQKCEDSYGAINGNQDACYAPKGSTAICTDGIGKYSCECSVGRFGKRCESETDWCAKKDAPACENGRCINTAAQGVCECDGGWTGQLCGEDINDCTAAGLNGAHQCKNGATCSDAGLNEFRCTCSDGWKGEFCDEDADDCVGLPCKNGGKCSDTGTKKFACDCGDGWAGSTCEEDVDECGCGTIDEPCWFNQTTMLGKTDFGSGDHGSGLCHRTNGLCVNTNGSYKCSCKPGFEAGQSVTVCNPIDECKNGGNEQCRNGAKCLDKHLGFECLCADGWFGDFCDQDLNECDASKHPENGTTWINFEPVFTNWVWQPPCVQNTVEGSSKPATCQNTDGSFQCICPDGYIGSGKEGEGVCSPDCRGKCGWEASFLLELNVAVTVQMSDQVTFSSFEKQICDEMKAKTGAIGCKVSTLSRRYLENAVQAKSSSKTVKAEVILTFDDSKYPSLEQAANATKAVVEGDNFGPDVIKALANTIHVFNVNLDGSVLLSSNWTCAPGFSGDGINCTDIDECALRTDQCHEDAQCVNTLGGYDCLCNKVNKLGKLGFKSISVIPGRVCEELHECDLGTHNCHDNANCSNIHGDFTCTCKPGFEGDGVECTNVDECLLGTDKCDPQAQCADTVGGYECTCNTGYRGDGFSCIDKDECADDTHNCHEHATCSQNLDGHLGQFVCSCNEGYQGSDCKGLTECANAACVDIDECSDTNLHTCHVHATCTNIDGNFTCACNSGHEGDGYNCEEVQTSTHLIIGIGAGAGGAVVLIIVIAVVVAVVSGSTGSAAVAAASMTPEKTADRAKKLEELEMADLAKPAKVGQDMESTDNVFQSKTNVGDTEMEAEANAESGSEADQDPEPATEPALSNNSHMEITSSSGKQIKLGSRVKVNGYQQGTVRYIGDLKDVSLVGMTYIGVELDEADGSGDGTINGHRYFTCSNFHAVFTTVQFVEPNE